MLHVARSPVRAAAVALRLMVLSTLASAGCTPTEEGRDEPDGSMTPRAPVASVVPTNGLIGEWKLDESSGTTAADTKNGFDADVFGGAAFVAGKIGNALNLNNGTAGTGGKYAEMPSNATLDDVQENSYTLSAWFYPYSLPPNSVSENARWAIIHKHGQNMGLVYNPVGRFVASHYLTGPTLVFAQSGDTYPVNAWYHVASVVNRTQGTVKVYVDGELQGTDTFTPNAAAFEYGTRPFRIGRGNNVWAADGRVDQVRIYNRALSDAEIGDLAEESPGSQDPTLRVGWMGMHGHVGEGPGGDEGTPYYRVVQWNPHSEGLADVPAVLAEAEQKGIILLAYTPGSPASFGGGTAFDLVAYEAQLDKLDTIPAFNEAVAEGRVFCYIGDEPNREEIWNDTWTPTLFNRAARENKERWPNCLTFGRISPELLTTGWGGGPALTDYDALDYAWLQYEGGERKQGLTIDSAITEQKAFADDLDVGLALSMNMMSAGLRTNLDQVTACWDYDGNPSTTVTGIVIGSPAQSGFSVGQQVPCGQVSTVPVTQNLIVNPDWIRRIAEVASGRPDIPFLLYWRYPDASAGSGPLSGYVFRSDFVDAFEDAIAFGQSRTNFEGFRTPKQP
jgi:Concanavalin A-like lectin/glucanases superfamily